VVLSAYRPIAEQATLPAETSRGRRPRLTKLAKQNDSPEVIGIVRGQALQLFADRHDADWIARPGKTTNLLVVSSLILRNSSDPLEAVQEPLPQLIPGLDIGVGFFGEAGCGLDRKRRLDTTHPIQGDLLPERDMPQLLVDCVRGKGQSFVSKVAVDPLKNVSRGCCCAVSYQGLG
jgi:hypothetical protein